MPILVSKEELFNFADKLGLREPARTLFNHEIKDIERRANIYFKIFGEGLELYSVIYN